MADFITYTQEDIKNCPYTNLIFASQNVLHNHTFFECSFIIQGESINHSKNGDIQLTTGNAILLKPSDCHSIEIKTWGKYRQRDIYLSEKKMQQLCEAFSPNFYNELLSITPLIFQIPIEAINYFKTTLNTFNSFGSIQNEMLDMLNSGIMSSMLSIYINSKINNSVHHPKWLNEFLSFINSDINMSKNINELIKSSYYSHGHLSREFKKYMGKTIIEYITETRIHYSTNLLISSDYSIIEIANMLGYNNQNNYIRNFKSIYGVPPSRWRNSKKSIRNSQP